MKTITAYKFVNEDMKSKNGDQKWEAGKWYKHEGKLSMCSSGFHACESPLSSLKYVYGDRWFEVQARGKIVRKGDKVVASAMRLVRELDVETLLVPFSYLCARRVLKNFEEVFPNDDRPRKAIEATEAYVKCPCEKHKVAARSAARSAAWSVSLSVAWSANSAASFARSAARSAEFAARSAASFAAESARSADSAAWTAALSAKSAILSAEESAKSAERKWQKEQLKELIRKV